MNEKEWKEFLRLVLQGIGNRHTLEELEREMILMRHAAHASCPLVMPPNSDMEPICIVADGRTVSYGFRRFTDGETLRRARQRWPHARTISIRKA